MLQNLNIRNVAIADNIDIDWSAGMTSISGETGAGKSILINSLNLTLGQRADSGIVRHGEKRAEVIATFALTRIPAAIRWLEERDLDQGDECILKRTVSQDGRSRAFINGQPVPLTELKMLGEMLIDIHSQHSHQSLLKPENHVQLLDEYANLAVLKKKVRDSWISWQGLERRFKGLSENAHERAAHKQLLQYQCQELDELALAEGEYEALETEFRRNQQREKLLANVHKAISAMIGETENSGLAALEVALKQTTAIEDANPSLENAQSLLESAFIQAQEAVNDLNTYLSSFEMNPSRQDYVETRLNRIHEIARKHQIDSSALENYGKGLQVELASLDENETELAEIESACQEGQKKYDECAALLSKERRQAAIGFAERIIAKLQQLAMPHAKFEVAFSKLERGSVEGIDRVEYRISLNPGQPQKPLAKVASGGELSRIALAIQVICAEHSTIPTLVFDEIDVGISGATAEIVGHMLRKVGASGQVLCVTHLPQVAALGHQQCLVSKGYQQDITTAHIQPMSAEQRIDEIARMLGGIDITMQTKAHAKEMLRTGGGRH